MEKLSAPPLTTKQEIAKEKFVRALRRAKRDSVDVDEIFSGEKERILLANVKVFGVGVSIIWGLAAPLVVVILKLWCITNHVEHHWIPVDLSYWMALVGWLSMMAFAFNLVDLNDFIPKLPMHKKRQSQEEHLDILFSAHDDGAQGDV